MRIILNPRSSFSHRPTKRHSDRIHSGHLFPCACPRGRNCHAECSSEQRGYSAILVIACHGFWGVVPEHLQLDLLRAGAGQRSPLHSGPRCSISPAHSIHDCGRGFTPSSEIIAAPKVSNDLEFSSLTLLLGFCLRLSLGSPLVHGMEC